MKQYCNILANVIAFTLLCTGCPSDSESGDGSDIDATPQGEIDAGMIDASGPSPSCQEATEHSDYKWIQANIFDKSCTFSSCHSAAPNAAGQLSLTMDLSYAELMDIDSTQEAGKKRVVANNCDDSYLYQKITNMNIAPGKKPMPLPSGGVFTPLCVEKQEAICNWIMAGAPND